MDAAAEVKSRLNIEDVISEYVQLKRAGRNFKGLSPWTNEKTASFMVSPEKQIWHDFSSGKGGDAFSFVMEMEGMDFRGALEHLARKAGVDLEQFQGARFSANTKLKERLRGELELATRFYQKQLGGSRRALEYLIKERKFSKKTLLDWQLGYAPNTGSALVNFLSQKNYTPDEIKRGGLSFAGRQGAADMFRGRIMIPLADATGQVIGFTARLLIDEEGAPKYINTPQTLLYDKGRHVFGLHLAKEAIRKEGFVVVAEGNMDVIASHQAGVTNVVASAGTAMTESHLKELKRFTGDIRLSFDADSAGIAAAERVIPLAQAAEVSLSIIGLAGAKDPDELIKKDVVLWQKAIKNAQSAPEWLIDQYKNQFDLGTAQGKKLFSDKLVPTLRRLRDAVEQEHYLKQVADLTDTSLEALRAKLSQQSPVNSPRLRRAKTNLEADDKNALENQKLQDHLLAMLLAQPKLRGLMDDLKDEYFSDGPARQLLKLLRENPGLNYRTTSGMSFSRKRESSKENVKTGSPTESGMTEAKLKEISDYVKILSLQFEELYLGLDFGDLESQAYRLQARLIGRYVNTQKQKLSSKMQETTDTKKLAGLMQQANELNKLLK